MEMIEDFIQRITDVREQQDLQAGLLLCEKISYHANEFGRKWDYEGNPAKSENLEKISSLRRLLVVLDNINKQISSTAPSEAAK